MPELYVQSNLWSCIPTSLAMVLDLKPAEVIEACGHDGSLIFWPDSPEPYNRVGFHVQEIIDVCLLHGRFGILIHAIPTICPREDVEAYQVPMKSTMFNGHDSRLRWYLHNFNGVLFGEIEGRYHAVAWFPKEDPPIFDPTGRKYGPERFSIEFFLAVL